MADKDFLLALPENIRENILLQLSGTSLHNLRQVNKFFNHLILTMWKSERGKKYFNMILQSNWRFPVLLRATNSLPLLYKYEVDTDEHVLPFDGFIDAVDEENIVIRTWASVDLHESRVLVYNTSTCEFWEVPQVNSNVLITATDDDFSVLVTNKLLILRVEIIGPHALNLVRVWSLETKELIYTANISNIKVMCVRKVLPRK